MPDNTAQIAALPIWVGQFRLAPLLGGLSNRSFVATDSASKYVVRLTRDFPFHHVYRDREVMTARAAHAAGFGPELIHAEPGVMVTRFVEGRVLDAADVRANIARIAAMIRRFHRDMPAQLSGPGFMFWPFHIVRDYALLLEADGHPPGAIARWRKLNAEFEAAQAPLPIIVGHNDLLAANLIDDGTRIWLIDYEYAGFSTAMFDLANLSSNAGFSEAESETLLAAYFGEVRPALRHSHAAMECISLLREALWSLVSVGRLDAPGADYAQYAKENFQRLDVALAAYRARFPEA